MSGEKDFCLCHLSRPPLPSTPFVISSEARNLIVPDRAKAKTPTPAVISKRSEKSCLSVEIRPCEDLSLAVEMTTGEDRDDSGGKSR